MPRPLQTIDSHGAEVQKMFGSIAVGYDRANRWMSWGTDVAWRRKAVAAMLDRGETITERVLDLCAGTLDSSLEIHAQAPQADIAAGDFSLEMLQRGERKLAGPARQRITVTQMDAHALPFSDESFDALFCGFGVRNLSDIERATAEQFRCLRPGGRLTILDFFRPERPLSRLVHSTYNKTVLPLVGWAATGNLAAYRYLSRSIGRFERVDTYADLLRAIGFAAIEITPLTFGIACIVCATRPALLPARESSAAPGVGDERV
jgi:ubiquinone/menaquinone biosynthesis methyltransferase